MPASEWDQQSTKLREVMRLWVASGDVKKGSAELRSYVLTLSGRLRTTFWRARVFDEQQRTVTLTFDWRDPDTSRGNRDWQQIELIAKSQPTPSDNLAMLVKGLNDVRLSFKRANTRVLYNVLNQMWPPQSGGAPRIVYRDRVVHERAAAHPPGSPFAYFHVDEDAPFEVVRAVYQSMTRTAHPDLIKTRDYEGNPTGLVAARAAAHTKMIEINAVWERAQAILETRQQGRAS